MSTHTHAHGQTRTRTRTCPQTHTHHTHHTHHTRAHTCVHQDFRASGTDVLDSATIRKKRSDGKPSAEGKGPASTRTCSVVL
jgi:hypothetical protein